MSAVGKESPIEDVDGVLEVDNASIRKVPTRQGGLYETSKVNLLPTHQVHSYLGLGGDRRRILGQFSGDLELFVAPLEAEIKRCQRFRARKFRTKVKIQARVADLVIDTVRQIAHRETGIFSIDAPLHQLLSLMCAGSVEGGIVTGLIRRAQKALQKRDGVERERGRSDERVSVQQRGLSYDISRELDELSMFVKWYVRRKMSLADLQINLKDTVPVVNADGGLFEDEGDVAFGLDLMHDHQVFGVKGCLLSCGLRLIGRDGQALWLRVSVERDGKEIPVRSQWSSWCDPAGGNDIEVLPAKSSFCSLVPIRPNSQRLVIDEIRAFFPYAALDLEDGRQEVDVVLSVIDEDGEDIIRVSRPESLCIPSSTNMGPVVPAPHALGMWPHDVVSGDKISEFSVVSAYKLVAGWERNSITVQFDLSLFMHAGESVTLECRFVNDQGEVVELSSLGVPYVASELNVAVESVSSYRYRRVLNPKSAWALYQGLCIDVPVEFLQLDAGTHDITCELVIVSEDERILCGDMGRVSVTVPLFREEREKVRGQVELESIEVDSGWSYGRDESIRVQATFCPQNSSDQIAELAAGRVGELFSPYRVLISLEREDEHVLLQAFSDPLGMSFKPVTRSICVEGHSEGIEHSVVTNFSKEEVLGWSFPPDSARVGSKVRLFSRVTALNVRGEVIASDKKEFFVKIPSAGGRQVVKVTESLATLSDVVAHTNVEGGILTVRALVNLPANDIYDDAFSVSFSVSDGEERIRPLGEKEVVTHRESLWTRQQMGVTQIPVEIESLIDGERDYSDLIVRVTLVSSIAGELDVIEQPIKVTGVITEASEVGEKEDSVFPDPTGFDPHSGSRKDNQTKTLWKRLFR